MARRRSNYHVGGTPDYSAAEQIWAERASAANASRMDDVAAKAEERHRRQAVLENNHAAYDAAADARANAPHGISVFSTDGAGNNHWSGTADPWGDAMKNQQEAQRRQLDAQNVYNQYDAIVQRANGERKRKRSMDDATLSSMMLQAKRNNGFVPSSMMDAVNAQLGTNLVGGNFTQDGNFVLYNKTRSANGSESISPFAVASPEMQYGVLSRSGLGLDMQRGIYGQLSKKRTADQLAKMGIVAPDTKLQQKEEDVRANLMRTVMRSNDPSEFVKALLTNKDFMAFASRGKQIVDKDGNPVMDDNGNPMYEQLSTEDVYKNAKSMYDDMRRAREEANNNIPGYREMMEYFTSPKEAQPSEAEAAEMDRMNRIAQPQQLIKYVDEDGHTVAGNGYIEGDNVYDGNGRLIEGATPVGNWKSGESSMPTAGSLVSMGNGASPAPKAPEPQNTDGSDSSQPPDEKTREEARKILARRRAQKAEEDRISSFLSDLNNNMEEGKKLAEEDAAAIRRSRRSMERAEARRRKKVAEKMVDELIAELGQ